MWVTISKIKSAYLRNELRSFQRISLSVEWTSNWLSIICHNRVDRCNTLVCGHASSRRYVGGFYREIENYANIISDTAPKKRQRPIVRSPLSENSGEVLEVNLRYDASLLQPVPHPSHVMLTSLSTNSLSLPFVFCLPTFRATFRLNCVRNSICDVR